MESNLNYVEQVVSQTLKRVNYDTPLSSEILTRELGKTLAEEYEGDGILKSAYLKKVPVYIPAYTDSEMGLDVARHGRAIDKARAHVKSGDDLTVCAVSISPSRPSIPTWTSIVMPVRFCPPRRSGFLRSAAGCREIGRNRSDPILKSATIGWVSL